MECYIFFCFQQKTTYEMRISDWSSDVCSSDLRSYGRYTGSAAAAGVLSGLQDAVRRNGIRHGRIRATSSVFPVVWQMKVAENQNRPLASVLITNHNYGRYLTTAIEAALSQSYAEVEVIVVDDGSTDGSREVIERYDGRVRPIFQDRRGQPGALTAAVEARTEERRVGKEGGS